MTRPIPPIVLEGRQVRLEPLSHAHAEGMVAAIGDDRSTYGLTWVPQPTLASVSAYIEAALAGHANGTALPFATVRKIDGTVAGSTRFGNVEYWDPLPETPVHPSAVGRTTPNAVEIGWTWLGASFQRSALNTEAKYLMLCHAFEIWKVLRLTLKTDARNARSRDNIERVGATFEGVLRNHSFAYDGGIRDAAFYSITLDEWPARKASLEQKMPR